MTDFYAPEDPFEETSDIGFGGDLEEPFGDEGHSPDTPSWPGLRWRGDISRRHLTAGTLLQVVAVNGGAPGESGVTISTVELELRRLASKYSGKDAGDLSYGKTINGELLHSEISYIRPIIHALVYRSGYLEYVDVVFGKRDTPTEAAVIRLTEEGAIRHEGSYIEMMSDGRFEHIDSSDPILELDVTSPAGSSETLVEVLGVKESTLPLRRSTKGQPTYREWLAIIANNPITYAVVRNGLDPATPAIYAEGAVEGTAHIVAAFSAAQIPREDGSDHPLPLAYWATRVQAEFIRPFAKQVLSGGPDAMWIAKPIKPHEIHKDIEAFVAAGRSGFSEEDDMTRRSSLAWEMFDADEFPYAVYSQVRSDMAAAQLEQDTVTVTHVPPLEDVKKEADKAGVTLSGDDVLGPIPEIKADKRGVTGLPSVERVVMKHTSDALMDSVTGREVLNPGDALKPGKMLRVRCDYVFNAKRPDGRRACDRYAVGGSTRCETHGGEYLDHEETVSLLKAGRSKLMALSSKAIDTVGELMVHSTNDAVRLAAAKIVLDRTGYAESVELNVNVGGNTERPAGDIIAERLAALAPRAKEIEPPTEIFPRTSDAETPEFDFSPVDAEVVEEE